MLTSILPNSEIVQAMLILVLFSLITRTSVGIHNQNWIKTFSGTMTLILLPIITFAITSVISGNIALSLGMIGALSIVRFRNPVRSSFELVIFFLMLSLGICAAADTSWLIILGLSSNLLIIGAYLLNKLIKQFYRKELFATSFSEGNTTNTLEITLSSKNDALFQHSMLISFFMAEDEYIYRLASSDVLSLKKLSSQYQNNAEVVNIKYSTG